MTMKRAKGKKREEAAQPDLTRIYGWHSDSDESSDKETAKDIPVSPIRMSGAQQFQGMTLQCQSSSMP